jgi:CRP-like cAMP-binding protein
MTSRVLKTSPPERRASEHPSRNQILASLPASELAEVTSHARQWEGALRQELFEQGDEVELVYFPLTGMASLLVVLSDGTSIEAMTIGREGFVGVQLLNGVTTARYRGICQIEGSFLMVESDVFLSLIDRLPDLRRRLQRYAQFASEVLAQSAACNSVHTSRQRCAKWLLITADATGSNEFHLTHEFLSQMLAVRRAGVTQALGALATNGLLSSRYGRITLIDVDGLKRAACECYETIRAKAGELLAVTSAPSLVPSTDPVG